MNLDEKSNFPSSIPSTDINSFRINPEYREWSGPFTFVQAADTQFGMIDTYVYKLDDPKWDKEIELTTQSIKQVNALTPKPKFYIVCGDMLDAFPFKKSLERRERQYKDFIEVFKELDPEIKLICVCGNHDIGDNPTAETLKHYRSSFGPDYFTFWYGGVKFVVLNSQYFKSAKEVPDEIEAHDKFMQTIADPSAKHIVVFQHIPFFLETPSEEDNYFTIDKELRQKLLDHLYDSGVRYIFCGHYHRNAGGKYKDLEEIVTSAVGCQMGEDKSGFRVVNVEESQITHIYTELSIQHHTRKSLSDLSK